MVMLNGEEEPPAVELTLVVTLEELGMLSSDLLIFGCLIVFLGFLPTHPFLWFLGASCCSPRGEGVLWGGLSLEVALTWAVVWGVGGVWQLRWVRGFIGTGDDE